MPVDDTSPALLESLAGCIDRVLPHLSSEDRDILQRCDLEGWRQADYAENHVPAAVLAGLPLYSNATGVITVMESLILKGLPVGTTLAFCMSTVAASFPEFILLKQVMQWRLLATIFVILLANFMIVGWLNNRLSPWLFSGFQ